MIWGIILVFLGVVFLLSNYGIVSADIGKLWPVILVIVGIGMLYKGQEKKKR
jgi:phage shock protein C